jgi:hypothetical protein
MSSKRIATAAARKYLIVFILGIVFFAPRERIHEKFVIGKFVLHGCKVTNFQKLSIKF